MIKRKKKTEKPLSKSQLAEAHKKLTKRVELLDGQKQALTIDHERLDEKYKELLNRVGGQERTIEHLQQDKSELEASNTVLSAEKDAAQGRIRHLSEDYAKKNKELRDMTEREEVLVETIILQGQKLKENKKDE